MILEHSDGKIIVLPEQLSHLEKLLIGFFCDKDRQCDQDEFFELIYNFLIISNENEKQKSGDLGGKKE